MKNRFGSLLGLTAFAAATLETPHNWFRRSRSEPGRSLRDATEWLPPKARRFRLRVATDGAQYVQYPDGSLRRVTNRFADLTKRKRRHARTQRRERAVTARRERMMRAIGESVI